MKRKKVGQDLVNPEQQLGGKPQGANVGKWNYREPKEGVHVQGKTMNGKARVPFGGNPGTNVPKR